MESKDRKSARPSLFESAPAPAAQGDARVSPGKVDLGLSGNAGDRRQSRRRWPMVLAVGVVAVGLASWAVLSNRDAPLPMQASTASVADAGATDSSPAVLVEGGLAYAGQIRADDPLSILGADSAAGEGGEASEGGVAEPGEGTSDLASRFGLGTPTGAQASAARETGATGSRRAKRSGSASPAGKEDLLAVLMANIREQPENADGSANSPQTLDELIAQLSATAASGPVVASTADMDAADTADRSSANLQRQLRSCPAANTTAGIRCRQRLCAKHAGDPACPTQ